MNLLIQSPQKDIVRAEGHHPTEPTLLPETATSFFKNYWPLILLTLLVYFGRLATMPGCVESKDGLFFLRGIQRYSVVEIRPQWPGYPVYIWVGKLLNLFYGDRILALHMVSIVASTLTLWPIAGLTGMWQRTLKPGNRGGTKWASFTAALVWVLLPLSWLGGSEIFSDPLGLLLGLTLLWLCGRSVENRPKSNLYLPVAGVLAGLMLGTRLSYLVLLLPLAFAAWLNRDQEIFGRKKGQLLLPLLVAACFGLTVCVWLGWQLLMDGWKFFEAGDTHLVGHYTEWGGSVSTDKNLLTRPLRMVETLVVYGLGGWWPGLSLLRLPATLGLLTLIGLGSNKLVRSSRRTALYMAILWTGPYFAWILLGNDVDLARYDFPLVAILCVLAGSGLPSNKYLSRLAIPLIGLSLALITIPQAIEHHTLPPVGEQLVNYASANSTGNAYIINDDNPSLIYFLLDEAPNTYSLLVAAADIEQETTKLEAAGQTVYLTALPGESLPGSDWVPVARFCRGQFMESRGPLEVWLYEHGDKTNVSNLPLQCEPVQSN